MHLVADAVGSANLDSQLVVSDLVLDLVRELGLHLRHLHVQGFSNGSDYGPGISAVALVSESHITVHTAPERDLVQFCIFSCKDFKLDAVRNLLSSAFDVKDFTLWKTVDR